jgi:hypothetical protein
VCTSWGELQDTRGAYGLGAWRLHLRTGSFTLSWHPYTFRLVRARIPHRYNTLKCRLWHCYVLAC